MNIKTSRLARSFQQLIFSELADYKRSKIKQGADIIDLSVGSPDLSPPNIVMESLANHVQDPCMYGYTLKGSEEFHQAVSMYYSKRYGVNLNASNEVLQLMGSQDGLVHLPMLFAEEGDVILVPDPGYTAYETGISLSGATPYPMPLKKGNNFLPVLSEIPAEIRKKAKMMILNYPGNPIPTMVNRSFFEEVVQFALENEIIVVHDFAYSELVFDGIRPHSFLEVDGAKKVGVEFNSLSKSFNMAGCRIGYLVGNAEIVATLAKFKSNLDYGVFAPIQKAAIKALMEGQPFLEENKKIYQKRRDILVRGLQSIGWSVEEPKGTMFIWAEIPRAWSSKEFTYALIDRAGVVVTPGNAFGQHGEGFVRIALVQGEDQLHEAVERIRQSGLF